MSTFVLKIIAILTMLIDHIGATFISQQQYPELYTLFRGIGRLAFPIFVFLIVEGFYHTRDVKKYLTRLGMFALISEIPFDLAFYHSSFRADFIEDMGEYLAHPSNTELIKVIMNRFASHQNVFFTLFLGLMLITILDRVVRKFQSNTTLMIIMNIGLTVGFCAIAVLLKTDYDASGILLITAFYLFRGSKVLMGVSLLTIMCTMCNFDYYKATDKLIYIISIFGTLAIIPIAFYNGKKGRNVKYFFYIFYPAHLLVLFIIKIFL